MSATIGALLHQAEATYHDAFAKYADPRSESWLLCSSPLYPMAIMAVYMVFVRWLGPRLMENREAFDLRAIIVPYNALQVACNAYMAWTGLGIWISERYSFLCQPVDHRHTEANDIMANLVYYYYVIKIVDLLDTVFFVLRKKQKQASFLHVYHHWAMVGAAYTGCRFSLNGHMCLVGVINTFVHAVLYSYYLLTAIQPSAKGAFWKKYITILQLAQFAVLLVHNTLPLLQPACGVQKMWSAMLVVQCVFMLILFSDFYVKAYSAKRKPTKVE